MGSGLNDPVALRLAEVGLEFGHGLALDLSRISAALEALGRPQDRLPPVLHVAGTNGKGSTCAFLRAYGEAAGLRMHVFTSPHLIYARERVRLAGQLVSDAAFLNAIERTAACGVQLTFFETLTAAAFLLFSESPGDYLVLEVGMGGMHDATNVIARPAACVITPVDLDHQQFLGPTMEAIAVQKAGILKPGCLGVIGRQAPDALKAIQTEAAARGAPLLVHGVDFDAHPTAGGMGLQIGERFFDLPPPALLGPHQIDNAGLAAAAFLALDDPRMTADTIAAGLLAARWPGRLQPLTRGPLGEAARARGVALFADGAHNPHGARALANALRGLNARAPAKTVLVCGMFANKDATGILAALSPVANALVATRVEGGRASAAPEEVAIQARAFGLPSRPAESLGAALSIAIEEAGLGGRVVVCGSLHLVGAALAQAGGVD
jgi:dihydrofolate synthase / folylpolyglutamate synthase